MVLSLGIVQLVSGWIYLGALARLAYVVISTVVGLGLLVASVATLIAVRHRFDAEDVEKTYDADQAGAEGRCLACGTEFPDSEDECPRCGWSFR